MRPTFVVPVEDPRAVLRRLGELLSEGHPRCTGTVFRQHAVLRMRERARRFWSPYLYLEARTPGEEDEVDGLDRPVVQGRFAPHPHVWTLFMAIYGVLGMLGILGVMYGVSQWILDRPPWALAAGPAAGALIAFVYGAAFIGQGLGASAMYELRSLVDDAAETSSPPVAGARERGPRPGGRPR